MKRQPNAISGVAGGARYKSAISLSSVSSGDSGVSPSSSSSSGVTRVLSPSGLYRLKPNSSMNDLRMAAIAAKVTQKDVVMVFGDMLSQIAAAFDKDCAQTKKLFASVSGSPFGGSASGGMRKSVSLSLLHGNEDLMETNKDRDDRIGSLAVFWGHTIPNVSIGWYVWRVVYYLNKYPAVEPTYFAESEDLDSMANAELKADEDSYAMSRGLRCLLLAFIYVDRITKHFPDGNVINSYTIHRIILTAMLVATKFTDDFPIGVDVFAKLGGIQRHDMRTMELAFCSLIHFDFNISDVEFDKYCMNQLRLAFDVAASRGGSYKTPSKKPPEAKVPPPLEQQS